MCGFSDELRAFGGKMGCYWVFRERLGDRADGI